MLDIGSIDGGAPNLVGGSGFRASKQSSGGSMSVSAQDDVVLSVGNPYGYPVPHVSPDVTNGGMGFALVDNLWGTNYVMWQPFARTSEFNASTAFFQLDQIPSRRYTIAFKS